jgi:hypothetical protein
MDNTASVLVCDPNKEGRVLKIRSSQEEESLVQKSAPILPPRIAIVFGLLNIAPGKNTHTFFMESDGEICG